MRIVGVVAEYNPFHLGHAHQLRQAREAAHADAVVAVMSGCFMQRGDAAIVSPAVRAKMALQNGADAVILLPALWSVRDAEHFALGGVHLLTGLAATRSPSARKRRIFPCCRRRWMRSNPPIYPQ